jgi:hypothetical protein
VTPEELVSRRPLLIEITIANDYQPELGDVQVIAQNATLVEGDRRRAMAVLGTIMEVAIEKAGADSVTVRVGPGLEVPFPA